MAAVDLDERARTVPARGRGRARYIAGVPARHQRRQMAWGAPCATRTAPRLRDQVRKAQAIYEPLAPDTCARAALADTSA